MKLVSPKKAESSKITKNAIDFDWAYVQWLCIEYHSIEEKIGELYPEIAESDEFADEFNVVQDHRWLSELAELASRIELSMDEVDEDANLEVKIRKAETILIDFFQTRIISLQQGLEEFIETKEVELVSGDPNTVVDDYLAQMLPLFYDFNLKSTKSAFFDSQAKRDIAFKAFGRLIKTRELKITKLKKDFRTTLDQEYCFLSIAPFDDEFKDAKKRFDAGDNQYLKPEDIDGLEFSEDENREDTVEITIILKSIIDRQKFEPGDVIETSAAQAEKLISLKKAEYRDGSLNNNLNTDQTQNADPIEKVHSSKLKSDFRSSEKKQFKAQTKSVTDSSPSKLKYVQAWVLTAITANLVIKVVDVPLSEALLTSSNFENSSYWFVSPVVGSSIWSCVAILWYLAFSTLRISRVMPWILGLGGLGALIGVMSTYASFQAFNMDVPIMAPLSTILSFILAVFVFAWFFKTMKPERY